MNDILLRCQNCGMSPHRNGKLYPQVLGRIKPTGEIIVMRFGSGTTVIHSSSYSISCGCGFTYLIQGTVISGTIKMDVPQNYEGYGGMA